MERKRERRRDRGRERQRDIWRIRLGLNERENEHG